jgi:hypothetical protein
MKWLTEYFSAQAMIVSPFDWRRRLSAAIVYLRDETSHRIEPLAMHNY